MEIQKENRVLSIRGLRELNVGSAKTFRDAVCPEVNPDLSAIEVDLSDINFLDSSGLGALISLYKAAGGADGSGTAKMRLMNPQPAVQQVIELTRMHHLFEVVVNGERINPPSTTRAPRAVHAA